MLNWRSWNRRNGLGLRSRSGLFVLDPAVKIGGDDFELTNDAFEIGNFPGYPSIVIQQAIWLYFRFALSYRDVEDMLAERGIDVSYETVRRWALKFGAIITRKLRRGRPRPDVRWHLDEVPFEVPFADYMLPSRRHDTEAKNPVIGTFCAVTARMSPIFWPSMTRAWSPERKRSTPLKFASPTKMGRNPLPRPDCAP